MQNRVHRSKSRCFSCLSGLIRKYQRSVAPLGQKQPQQLATIMQIQKRSSKLRYTRCSPDLLRTQGFLWLDINCPIAKYGRPQWRSNTVAIHRQLGKSPTFECRCRPATSGVRLVNSWFAFPSVICVFVPIGHNFPKLWPHWCFNPKQILHVSHANSGAAKQTPLNQLLTRCTPGVHMKLRTDRT